MPGIFDDPQPDQAPTRVCRHCSTQSASDGDFCPRCGKSFVKRARLGKRAKLVLFTALALLVLGGGGTAATLKIQHDRKVKDERARAARIAEERREREAREAREEARREREEEKAERQLEEIERQSRAMLERRLRKSITKDATEKVDLGLLDGPILRTVCDPVGGGRDDLEASTGKYECLAVTEEDADGTYRGWEFSGTINYSKYSWSWELGDS